MCQRKPHILCNQGATDILERPGSILIHVIPHRKESCETSEHKEPKSKPPGEGEGGGGGGGVGEELIGDGTTAGVLPQGQ